MKIINIAICLLVFLETTFSKKLIFVIDMFRHGARGTEHADYFQKPTSDDKYWAGELTGVGQREHYLLGRQLRKEYIEKQSFLSKTMNLEEINVRSTDVNRTLQSAQSQLAGLYPMGTGATVPEDLEKQYLLPPYKDTDFQDLDKFALPKQFQTVPIHVTDRKNDAVLSSTYQCENFEDNYKKWKKEHKQKKTWENLNDKLEKDRKKINKILGQKVDTIDYYHLRDSIDCFLWKGKSGVVPEELQPGSDLYKVISFGSNYHSFWKYGDEHMHRILNTPLLNYWIDLMENALEGKSKLKWQILSSHETNVQVLMPALNMTSLECLSDLYFDGKSHTKMCHSQPKFAASILVELYKYDKKKDDHDDEGFVKIKFDGDYIPLCESDSVECDFKEFKHRLKHYMVDDDEYEKYCFNEDSDEEGDDDHDHDSQMDTKDMWVFIIVIIVQSLVILLLAYLFFCKRKQWKHRHQALILANNTTEVETAYTTMNI